jgi:capsular exopolysaccharide synthesis family protein
LGLGLAFLLDHLDNTLKTPEDIRTHLRAPFLGIVPEAEHEGNLQALTLVHGEGQGSFVEGYRMLRTALSYSWPDQAPHVVLVTSAMPGEGKTLTSVNLALTLASAEHRVLVIDCDLRRPGIHVAFDVPRTPGLSDILVGKAAPADMIRKVPGTRADVIAAGTPAPSPGDLLTGAGMKHLLDDMRRHYAWIILDTPPVGAVADPLILAPSADGVLVVAGAEMSTRGALRETLQQVTATGARVLGVLLNRAHLERRGYYGAYHRVRGNYQHART